MQKTENKWVEIISVRLSSPEYRDNIREIIDHVRTGRCPVTCKKITVELYVDQTLEMDWSIHLTWNKTHGQPGKTVLGSAISKLFGAIGLVNHKVWHSASI